jgi:hypothetical protein
MDTYNSQNSLYKFSCLICDYNCSKKSHYNQHLLTSKHKKNTIQIQCDTKIDNLGIINNIFKCKCGKQYKFSQGLSKHKKVCNNKSTEELPIINTKFVLELIKKNQELQDLLIEQNKQLLQHNKEVSEQNKQNSILINKIVEKDVVTNNTQNITNNNTINQKFNLNIFLNETCKDAMNLKEFIDNIKITFEQLLNIGDAGFVSGVSDIFVKQLRDLDITKRPIHCTDVKRETIYLKEENKWDKDDKDNTKLKTAIERVEYRNLAALHKWCQENPDSKVNNSKQNLLRDKIHLQVLQGDHKTRDKIIKNISKEITIDKNETLIHS